MTACGDLQAGRLERLLCLCVCGHDAAADKGIPRVGIMVVHVRRQTKGFNQRIKILLAALN